MLKPGKSPQAALTARLQHLVDSGRVAGLQVVVINKNSIAYQHAFGVRSQEPPHPLNDSTVLYAASLTKVVAAYTLLRMADAGVIDIDKPVYRYLKQPIGQYEKWRDLAHDTVAFQQITLRMLLAHTSGMPILRYIYGNKLDLIAKPGSRFYYSNEGMNFAGFVAEEHTGQTFDKLARQYTLAPLGMRHTSLVWDTAFDHNYGLGFKEDGSVYGISKRSNARAAGSMVTTASDYARFVLQLMKREGLTKSRYEDMLQPQIPIISRRGFGPERDTLSTEPARLHMAWGLGVGLFQSPQGKAFYHGGHDEANQNFFIAYPDQQLAVVLLSNSANFEPVAGEILKATIGDRYAPLWWFGYFDKNP